MLTGSYILTLAIFLFFREKVVTDTPMLMLAMHLLIFLPLFGHLTLYEKQKDPKIPTENKSDGKSDGVGP